MGASWAGVCMAAIVRVWFLRVGDVCRSAVEKLRRKGKKKSRA